MGMAEPLLYQERSSPEAQLAEWHQNDARDSARRLSGLGFDAMLATKSRSCVYCAFGMDVPFLM